MEEKRRRATSGMKRRGALLFQAMVEEFLPETETAFFVGKSLGDAGAGFLGESVGEKGAEADAGAPQKKLRPG